METEAINKEEVATNTGDFITVSEHIKRLAGLGDFNGFSETFLKNAENTQTLLKEV
jgi:hypothetical protein